MSYFNKLRITVQLIIAALFPERSCDKHPPPGKGAQSEIVPEDFAFALAYPGRLLRPDGTIEFHFIGASFPAAPFLLSRLKSCGFSGCKAVMTAKGILVTGRR